MDKEELRKKLTPEEFHVTQEAGTEPPFSGEFVDHKDDGTYTCKVCDAELFSSDTKFDSGSGWPSFYDVMNSDAVERRTDTSHGMERLEVVCRNCGAHLGHVFPDGPQDKTGDRYCINSVSLNFKEK